MLDGNMFTDVTCFSSDRWPLLSTLMLDKQVLSVANMTALGLSCDVLSDMASARNNESVYVSRRHKLPSEQHIWQHLSEVDFIPIAFCSTSRQVSLIQKYIAYLDSCL